MQYPKMLQLISQGYGMWEKYLKECCNPRTHLPKKHWEMNMAFDDIPQELYDFITQSVDSLELLRVLFLLYENPDRYWTVEQINNAACSSVSSIQKRLNDLGNCKLLSISPDVNGKFKFTPQTSEARIMIEKLWTYYQFFPYRVINIIYSNNRSIS